MGTEGQGCCRRPMKESDGFHLFNEMLEVRLPTEGRTDGDVQKRKTMPSSCRGPFESFWGQLLMAVTLPQNTGHQFWL